MPENAQEVLMERLKCAVLYAKTECNASYGDTIGCLYFLAWQLSLECWSQADDNDGEIPGLKGG
ncbi:MAG: hypothetical protein HQ559_01765 [Lentisphaerae bacterium]|nr:hypothetical protein [Lentisphaerota bacterium]